MANVFERCESEVRGYCRAFPTTFEKAEGSYLYGEGDKKYLDFFAGAGTLNYGHNPQQLKVKLIEYITNNGVVHALDMHTVAKRKFLETFEEVILKPRGLDYKVMFPGPTGTNAVEAALKLARKVTGRTNVVAFTDAFHGMTLGALACTGNAKKRKGAGVPLTCTSHLPYDGWLGTDVNTLTIVEKFLDDTSSGVDKPAAFIVESIQGEGGINACSLDWLKGLAALAKKHDILLILDDIQSGCGRSGHFFSFEAAGITPDIVTISKSLSGYGLPFALTVFRRDLDIWLPGEHNGTFRGFNPAFVTATEALNTFWKDETFALHVRKCSELAMGRLTAMAEKYPKVQGKAKGRGMMLGIEMQPATLANEIAAKCFQRGLVIETSGCNDQVLKLLPPLSLTEEELNAGLDIIESCLAEV